MAVAGAAAAAAATAGGGGAADSLSFVCFALNLQLCYRVAATTAPWSPSPFRVVAPKGTAALSSPSWSSVGSGRGCSGGGGGEEGVAASRLLASLSQYASSSGESVICTARGSCVDLRQLPLGLHGGVSRREYAADVVWAEAAPSCGARWRSNGGGRGRRKGCRRSGCRCGWSAANGTVPLCAVPFLRRGSVLFPMGMPNADGPTPALVSIPAGDSSLSSSSSSSMSTNSSRNEKGKGKDKETAFALCVAHPPQQVHAASRQTGTAAASEAAVKRQQAKRRKQVEGQSSSSTTTTSTSSPSSSSSSSPSFSASSSSPPSPSLASAAQEQARGLSKGGTRWMAGRQEGGATGDPGMPHSAAGNIPQWQMVLNLGIQQVNTGKFDDAIKTFSALIDAGMAQPSAYIGRGTAYALSRRLELAIEDYTRCIEVAPNMAEGWRRRAQARTAANYAQEAEEDFTEAFRLDPSQTQILFERAIVLTKQRKNWDAQRDLLKVIEEEPDNGPAYLNLGQAYTASGECEKAVETYHRALKLASLTPTVRRDIILSMGQAYRELSDVETAEECYWKAIKLDDRSIHAYRLLVTLRYQLGDARGAYMLAEQSLQVDPDNLDILYFRAAALQSMGYFAQAVREFDAIVGKDFDQEEKAHQHEAFFQREITTYTAMRRHRPLSFFRLDEELDSQFKEAWSKKFAPNVLFPGYDSLDVVPVLQLPKHEQGGGHNLKLTPHVQRLLDIADRIGGRTRYYWQGFVPNKRQFRAAGLAALDIMTAVRHSWNKRAAAKQQHGRDDQGGIGSSNSNGSSTSSSSHTSSSDKSGNEEQSRSGSESAAGEAVREEGGTGGGKRGGRGGRRKWLRKSVEETSGSAAVREVTGWRDVYTMAVRWRQISEPNDPVVWIDKLTAKEFEEGFGSVTAMLVGQMKNMRYYYNFPRALEIMKQRMADAEDVWDGYNRMVPITEEMKVKIRNATTAHDLWGVIGQDYWVVTPCYSIARPGVIMNGTRLTMIKTPAYFDFAIKTPGTPARWAEYDFEMDTAWQELADAVMDNHTKATNATQYWTRIQDIILRLTFYWYNFMPLARGTAMAGYVTMLGLMLAAGIEVEAPIPRGIQTDWEAILSPRFEQFHAAVAPWLYANLSYNPDWMDPSSGVPSVGHALPNLITILDALSFMDKAPSTMPVR